MNQKIDYEAVANNVWELAENPFNNSCEERIMKDAALAIRDLEAQLSAVGAGGVEALRKRDAGTVSLPRNEWEQMEYWLSRCEDKGHLENCCDLVEPWAALQAAIAAQSKGDAA